MEGKVFFDSMTKKKNEEKRGKEGRKGNKQNKASAKFSSFTFFSCLQWQINKGKSFRICFHCMYQQYLTFFFKIAALFTLLLWHKSIFLSSYWIRRGIIHWRIMQILQPRAITPSSICIKASDPKNSLIITEIK